MAESASPKKSILGFLTREGRLRNRWADALKETNPARSLEGLRSVFRELCLEPGVFHEDGIAFVNEFLHSSRAQSLTSEDLRAADEFAGQLATMESPPIPPVAVLLQLVRVYGERRETRQAWDVATRAYRCPGAARAEKSSIARMLAKGGARGDAQIDLYIEALAIEGTAALPEVVELLVGMFAVGFDSPSVAIKRAGEIAARVAARQISITGLHRALGAKYLVSDKNAAAAAVQFDALLQRNSSDTVALVGLLAARLREGKYGVPPVASRSLDQSTDPLASGLSRLHAVQAWFEDPRRPTDPPCHARDVEDVDWKDLAGDIPAMALGRLYLLEGDARRAARFLASLAGRVKGEWKLLHQLADALSQTDVGRQVQCLREVLKEIPENAVKIPMFWNLFLDHFLAPSALPLLDSADFDNLRSGADSLSRVHGFRLDETLRRVLQARRQRNDKAAVCDLILDLYHLPKVDGGQMKVLARELAGLGACGDAHIDVYLDHLGNVSHPAEETAVLGLLAGTCSVDFDSDAASLRVAGKVAGRLREKKIAISGLATALGLHWLLVENQPQAAMEMFQEATQEDRQDSAAAMGLAAAAFQTGNYQRLTKPDVATPGRYEAALTALRRLAEVVIWLDDRAATSSAPPLQGLDTKELTTFAGYLRDLAVGRLKLIHGDARGAVDDLQRALASRPDDTRCTYYAAWASWLAGDSATAVRLLTAPGVGSGKPELDCLLLEIDPANTMRSRSRDSELVRMRLALIDGERPRLNNWKPGSGTLAADLESLRTSLGCHFAERDVQGLTRAVAEPLFERLPMADRKMWQGLLRLANGEGVLARADLEEAAARLGHPRASLLLAVSLMQDGKFAEAKPFLELGARGRNDGKIAVLRAYIEAAQGRGESVAGQLERLGATGDRRARYTLGHIHLQLAEKSRRAGSAKQAQTFCAQAAASFRAALSSGKGSPSSDCEALAIAAAFAADPTQSKDSCAALEAALDRVDASRRRPWLLWNAFLIRLWRGTPEQAAAACDDGIGLLEQIEQFPPSAAAAIARQAAHLATMAADAGTAEKLESLIAKLGEHADVLGWRGTALAAATRLRYAQASESLRPAVRHSIGKLASSNPTNAMLAELAAQACLANGENAAAGQYLEQAQPADDWARRICASLARLVTGEAPAPEDLPQISAGMSAKQVQASHLLIAAAAFAGHRPDAGCDSLLTALGGPAGRAGSVIDASRFLPALCASAARKRLIPTTLVDGVRSLAQGMVDDRDLRKVAQCAAVIGEANTASRLLEKAATRPDATLEDVQTYVAYLSHLAVSAWNKGDHMGAVRQLNRAGEIGG